MFDKFHMASHSFIHLAGSLRICKPYRHHGLRSLKTTSNKFTCGTKIRLNLVAPPSTEPRVLECGTTDELAEYIKLHRGSLAIFNEDGSTRIIHRSQYAEVSPCTTYNIISPFYTSFKEKIQHHQVA